MAQNQGNAPPTIVEEQAAFAAALTRFGFPQAAAIGILNNGLLSTNDLIGLEIKDIENIVKIVRSATTPPTLVPYMAQRRLEIMCYWVNRRHRLQEPINADLFNQMTIEAFGKLMNMESQAQQEDSTQVKAPSEFKPGSKWKPFKEGAIAYFNSIKTKSMIPLSNVIRDQAQPHPDGLYDSEHQRLIAVTPLEGIEFSEDNGKVFDYLKSWTLNGPA